MSIHALIATAYVEHLDPGRKWVLAAIADSADEFTLESAPGLAKLRAWSGLSESRTKSVVTELIGLGLIERIASGRIGRRAVYRVFPQGVPAIPRPAEVAARFDPSQPVDNPEKEGATGGTPNERGCHEGPTRVPSAVPLHASTSVFKRAASSTGFPGARPPGAADRPDPRSQRGHHDTPCNLHPDQIVPCGRCAHAAANSDVTKIEDAKRAARDAVRNTRLTTTASTTDTEEHTA